MGTKYTTESLSGYNQSPPVDDGSETEANKLKWATHKEKLGDPLKTQVAAIDTKLVAAADVGPDQHTSAYTTVVGDHQKTLEATSALAFTLLAVASAPAGYTVNFKNNSGGTVTVDASGSETIDGSTGTISLSDKETLSVQLDQAGTGYIINLFNLSSLTSSVQTYKGVAGGTVDVITTSASPTLSALTDTTVLFMIAAGANTSTTPTLNVDSLGAQTITKNGGQALVAGDIFGADHELILKYDAGNTNWELLNPGMTVTAFARTILDDATAGDVLTTLGVSAFAQTLLDDISAAAALVTLGLTATAAELNTLDGITSTVSELNILDGVTSTAAELNILDGVTSTAAELNILDGVTSTASELNKLDGYTGVVADLNITAGANAAGVTAAEVGYLNDVTSDIQAQLDGKSASSNPSFRAEKSFSDTQNNITGYTQITFTLETFDTHSDFSSSRFTPSSAGKYSITGKVKWYNISVSDSLAVIIYKNGSLYSRTDHDATATTMWVDHDDLIDMNGTTDYVEIYVNNWTRNTSSIADYSYFSGHKV